MRWSVMPFGKYKGKTFPEIIVRDPDWFFWVLPKLYRKRLEVAYEFDMDRKFCALSSLTPIALLPDGQLDCHASICGGLFAKNTTSEQAGSCFGISAFLWQAQTTNERAM
jgi:hypothetical protein